MKTRACPVAVALLAFSPGLAFAQSGFERPQPGLELIQLLRQQPVQEELKLSEEQLKKFPEFRLKLYRQRDAASVPLDDAEVRSLVAREMAATVEKELQAFLSADQLKRLKQIDLQVNAANGWGLITVFRRSEVGKELNLTDAQREQLAGIRNDISSSYRTSVNDSFGGSREEIERRQAGLRDKNNAKVEQLLTDAQRAKWKEMLGPEFKHKIDLRARPASGQAR